LILTSGHFVDFSQVHMMIQGPTVFDICQHFVERWNFIYNLKYVKKRGTNGRYELLAFPQIPGQGMPDDPSHPDHEPATQHPHYENWAQAGRRFFGMEENARTSTDLPRVDLGPKGNMNVQVVRSCGDWSNGTTTEVRKAFYWLSIWNSLRNLVIHGSMLCELAFHSKCLYSAY
jgi:phospholipase D1/2